jgi:crotonobetainyl-CoA:carnitine CoA-transferase CaiB-like acyl-CoA transferase
LFTGLYAAVAILAALRHRDATGEGQVIDMALLDTQVAILANLGANYMVTGKAPRRAGNAHQNIVPYQVFACADGHLILAVGNDGQFAKFCEVAGHAEWARDERFARNENRVRHRGILVAAVVATRAQQEWLAALEAVGVPCGPINKLDQVFADPQLLARGMRIDLPHPLAGSVPQVNVPVKMSGTPLVPDSPPPLLAQHTLQVLRERLALSEDQIATLAAEGVIGIGKP